MIAERLILQIWTHLPSRKQEAKKCRGFSRLDLLVLFTIGVLSLIALLTPASPSADQRAPANLQASQTKQATPSKGLGGVRAGVVTLPQGNPPAFQPGNQLSQCDEATDQDCVPIGCVLNPSNAGCQSKCAANPNDSNCQPFCSMRQNLTYCLAANGAPRTGGYWSDNKIQNPFSAGSGLFFSTSPEVTVNHEVVQQLWKWMLGVVDVGIVLVLLLNGIHIMLSGSAFSHARALEMLPGVLLALIAAHISMIFISFFLGLNNSLSVDLYAWVNTHSEITQSGLPEKFDFNQPIVIKCNDLAYWGDQESCTNYMLDPLLSLAEDQAHGKQTDKGIVSTRWIQLPQTYTSQNQKVHDCQRDTDDLSLAHKDWNEDIGSSDPDTWQSIDIYNRNHPDSRKPQQHKVNVIWHCKLDKSVYVFITPVENHEVDWNLPDADAFWNWKSLLDGMRLMIRLQGLMLFGQSIIRLFLINLYTVLSPLAIFLWALPGGVGQQLTRQWLRGFVSMVLVQFLQVAALIITQILAAQILGFISGQIGTILRDETLIAIINVGILWFVLRIPSLLGVPAMDMLMDASHSMGQAMTAALTLQVQKANAIRSFIPGAGIVSTLFGN